MDILNSTSLGYMLEKCSENTEYHGMIAFNGTDAIKTFIKEFVRLHKQSTVPNIRIIKQHYQSGTIEFTNGSIIYLVLANSTSRGRKCHAILFDEAIDVETRHFFSRYLIPYKTVFSYDLANEHTAEEDPMDKITDTEELENFLNEFNVHP